jgi:mono/diheme cytochrome c family protein
VKNFLKVALFTVLVTAFYAYVGQMVPQKEVHPPKDLEVRADMSTAELVQAGKQIAEGKGTCTACHTIGSHEKGRFPDLGGIGGRAGTRKPGMSDVEYLLESLSDPNAYIVEGFSPGMPPVDKPPIDLSDMEMLAVIAYLQSLGGTPTVTPSTPLVRGGPAGAAAAGKGAP